MTNIVGIATTDSIWMCGDRRLTANNGRRDDARKVVALDCPDGVALIGYAGLGATRLDAPDLSTWITNTLNGRYEPVVRSLQIIAEAAQRRIWPKLDKDLSEHHFAIVAFVDGKPRVCGISLGTDGRFQFVEHPFSGEPYFIYAGSGARKAGKRESKMRHALLQYERGSKTAEHFARVLASINLGVSAKDKFVGPTCTVGWRFRNPGGDAKAFDRTSELATGEVAVPIVARGVVMEALLSVALPEMMRQMDALRAGIPYETDVEAHNAELAKLPDEPDDRLP